MGEIEILGMHSEVVEYQEHESQERPALVVAAERYEQAASTLHGIESLREQALSDAREAVTLLGSDPYNLLGESQPRRKPRASGGNRVTANQIIDALPATAGELAERFGTSVNNVNGHLSRLKKSGQVEKGDGRPAVYHHVPAVPQEDSDPEL